MTIKMPGKKDIKKMHISRTKERRRVKFKATPYSYRSDTKGKGKGDKKMALLKSTKDTFSTLPLGFSKKVSRGGVKPRATYIKKKK